MSEGLKILHAEVENFKGLKPIKLDINGRSMMIVGPNASNKSSFLQAIMSPMNAKMKPTEAINVNEERAHIELTIGGIVDGKETRYDVELRFSQDHKKGRLIVKDAEGSTLKSPKDSLAAIVGNISFDVDEFIALAKTAKGTRSEAGVKQQIEILKELLPSDIRDQLLKCDADYAAFYTERKELNSEIKTLEAQNQHEFSDEELKTYSQKKDVDGVKAKMNELGDAIQNWSHVSQGLAEKKAEISKIESLGFLEDHQHNMDALMNLITDFRKPKEQTNATFLVHCNKYKSELEDKINRIKTLPKLLEEVQKGEEWLQNNPKPSTETLMAQLTEAEEWNKKCDQVAGIMKRYETIIEKKKDSDALSKAITESKEAKKKIFASNPLPVEGLSFDEENVLYKGLPFNEDHHPSSHIIGIGVKIAIAMNPNLKVVMIKDGSLLDKTTANYILQIIEEAGYQLFIEMVSWNGAEMAMEYVESEFNL